MIYISLHIYIHSLFSIQPLMTMAMIMRICRQMAIRTPVAVTSSFNTGIIIHIRASSTIPRYYVDFSEVKKVSDAVFLFNDMLRMRPLHSILPFNQLLNLVVHMQDYSLALHMFDKMRQCSVAYNEYTLSIVINCYCLLNRVDLGFSMLGILLKSGLVPDVTTFNTLINGLLFDNKGADAVLLFKKLYRETLCEPDEFTFSTVIDCYCLMYRVDLGLSVFSIFLKSGLVPNVITFNTLVSGLLLDNKGVDAVLLFKKLLRENLCEPTEVTFSIVIDSYCLMNRVDLGFSVFGIFLKSGLVPNVITFSTLIHGLLLDSKGADAVLLFKKLYRENLCEPNEVILNTVINCYILMNQVDLGFSVLSIFLKSGLVPDVTTFSTLIHGLFLDNKVTNAVLLFKKLSRENLCEPNEVTFGTVIDGLCKLGHVHIAVCLLGRALVEGSLKIDVVCYNPIIDSFCKDGMVDNALLLFSKMAGMGIKPSVVTYNSIVQGLCDFSRWKEAKDLLNRMIYCGVLPDLLTHSILIDAFCKQGNLEKAKSVLAVMVRKNVAPDIVTYSALMHGYCQWGEMEKGRKVFDLISHFGLQPNIITYNTMLHGFFQDGLVKEAMDLFVELENSGLQPNVTTFTTIIGGLCQNGLLKEAKRMFVEMEKCGCVPYHVTYYVIVRGCLTHNVLQEAQSLLEEMKSKGLSLDAANVHMLFDHCLENDGDGVPLDMIKKMFQLN